MPESALEQHEIEYRARQIRLGTWVAVGVILIGAVRAQLDWRSGPWVVGGIALMAVGQAGLALLPWERYVQSSWLPRALGGWWLANLALLLAYTAYDTAALTIFPAGVMLVLASAAALAGQAEVIGLGALSGLGYLALFATRDRPMGATLAALTVALMVGVAWFCAQSAGNRRRTDRARRSAERKVEALLEASSDAVLAIQVNGGGVTYASPSVKTVLGYDPRFVTSAMLSEITHPDFLPVSQEWWRGIISGGPGYTGRAESRVRRADGAWIWAEVIGTNRTTEAPLFAAVISIRDITGRKELEEELTRQAFADSLTGMPNRALFRDRLEHAIARNRRGGGRITLLLVDLDDFKLVNDSLGHNAGDQLIATTALRLHQQLRAADTLARLGGDEFAILVEDITEIEAMDLADRLLAAIRRPLRLGTRDVVTSASIGVATAKAGDGDDGPDPGELLRNADLAMYAAKGNGRDRYALFDPAMYAGIMREAEDRAELELALARQEFVVHYQPIVDLPTSRLIGVEALVRWEHPARGMLGPNTFIPLAESTGLIVPLGRWVLRQACEQLAEWRAQFPAAAAIRVNINLSARQFQHEGLVEEVAGILAETGVDPHQIVLEITESLLMQDTDSTIETLGRLKALGVRLAIDDFGTGYSSLSYLKRFPVDILKIDRSFVDGITTERGDATLAEAVVQLGRALQLQTVAEGIETAEQWSTLQDLGCEFGQGYLFARPGAADAISSILGDARVPESTG
ncbi:GGDEF domain-containing protein [Dactylosporangium vinaceum]|uniref:Bifunctional diguanylate cyclase/phosphodiesterase n=1 Tax=Dactylosporangium vinaceum TaxID=53362 RepID=A0ABV5MMK6_9ACTN|nr:bifunctional diguanylate cyclase/phosphodiesterase [Dactylosporangium vinaceum]UAB93207.1 GGDEF domain-containing protein [Dactylosporangium vinaceum]